MPMTITNLMVGLLAQNHAHPPKPGSKDYDAFWTVMEWLRQIGGASAPDKSCAFCDGTGITTESHPYAKVGSQCTCRFGTYDP